MTHVLVSTAHLPIEDRDIPAYVPPILRILRVTARFYGIELPTPSTRV